MRIQFFSQLRDIVNAGEITLDLPEGASIEDLLARLYRDFPGLEKWDRNILVGVGLDFVGRDYLVQPNDQIAIMPPLQGG